jgi:hypothetical protein
MGPYYRQRPVQGSLDKKGGKKEPFLLSKRWHHLPLFSSNEPCTRIKKGGQYLKLRIR